MTLSASKCSPLTVVAFLIRSQLSLHWRSIFRKKLMVQDAKVASNTNVENLWTTISYIHFKRLKSLSFGEPRLGQTPIVAPLIFGTFSLFLLSNHLKNLIHLALTV